MRSIWRHFFRWVDLSPGSNGERQAEAEAVAEIEKAKLAHTQDVVVPGYSRLTDRLGQSIEKALRSTR